MKKTLLLDYTYFPPVGHAVEALRLTLGYHAANPDLEISVVLNRHTAYILASLCPWIKNIYLVDLYYDTRSKVTLDLILQIPKDWDYVLFNHRAQTKQWCPGSYFKYFEMAKKYYQPKIAFGYEMDNTLPYISNLELKLDLPKANINFAKKYLLPTKIKIAILPAGNSEPFYYPSAKSWEKIIKTLGLKYPDVSFYLLGKFKQEGVQTTGTGFSGKGFKNLLTCHPKIVNCFDIGLLNQLAVIQKCDLFISPHTGFAFAAQTVGMPWLAISGGRWYEYLINGVPLYSVLPDPIKYPCFHEPECWDKVKDTDGTKRIKSMTVERIVEDLPKIVRGAEILIEKKWDFDTLMKRHFKELQKYLKSDELWAFDNFQEKYINTK